MAPISLDWHAALFRAFILSGRIRIISFRLFFFIRAFLGGLFYGFYLRDFIFISG